MLDIFSSIGKGLVTLSVAVASFVGIVPQNVQAPVNLSGTFQTPEVKALFTTSLASKITSTATSMTLVSATDKDGNTLASSTYGFIIDEGTSAEEFVLADCTGTTCTNMTRGISVTTATSSVTALQFEHRRGASVKITTAPSLVFVMNVLKGKQNLETPLKYSSSVATSTIDDDNRNLVNYELLAYTAFNGAGVVDASATQKGVVELATSLETASSTPNGSVGVLAIPASNATSTYNSATAGLKVVVTQNNGKIDNNFISTTTLGLTASSSTIVNGIPLLNIGKNFQILTTLGTSTFSVPSGITKINVEVQGPGGNGGTGVNGSPDLGGGGGGGGGYSLESIDVSATSTIQYFIGATAESTKFGTNGFYLSASSGSAGANANGANANQAGGAGGTGSGGDLNTTGSGGTAGGYTTAGICGGTGGGSFYGGGAVNTGTASSDVAGSNGGNYGGGASGGCGNSNGGTGAQGMIKVTW